jgi:hypothetical protein
LHQLASKNDADAEKYQEKLSSTALVTAIWPLIVELL